MCDLMIPKNLNKDSKDWETYGVEPKEIPVSTPESTAAFRLALLAQLNSSKITTQKTEDKSPR